MWGPIYGGEFIVSVSELVEAHFVGKPYIWMLQASTNPTGWCPPVIGWFIAPSEYSFTVSY